MSRSTARVAAMQLIFEKLSGGEGSDDTLHMIYDELRDEATIHIRSDEPGTADRAWIGTVLEGVLSHLDELDQVIGKHSIRWTIDRMPHVDLTILRLAAWELLYEPDTPGNVVINEAVELAHRYSEPASASFINGVLGTILREKEAANP